jgi:putative transposase
MPNHAHTVIEQMEGYRLGDIIGSWKSFSANRINKLRGCSGKVWAKDYFDRYIRNEIHLANAVNYVEGNPVKAGLTKVPQDWPHSSASVREV